MLRSRASWRIEGLFLLLLFFGFLAFPGTAQATQRTVLAELFTATWCGYCPSGEQGFQDLEAVYETDEFLPIIWHLSDSYTIGAGTDRASAYGVSGIPHAIFDGYESEIGGLPSGSMYSYYNPIVSNHLSMNSPLAMTADYLITGTSGVLKAHIEVTSIIGFDNNWVHFVITERNVEGLLIPVGIPRAALTDESFSLTEPGSYVDIVRNFTVSPSWNVDNLRIIVFVQTHSGTKRVHQAVLATEGWSGPTIDVAYDCIPDAGTVPFQTGMWVQMENLTPVNRRDAGRINVRTGNGVTYSNWKSGYTNLGPNATYLTNWNQMIPALSAVIGDNIFTLVGMDVTPSPFNQPPYPVSGGTATDVCTVHASAP